MIGSIVYILGLLAAVWCVLDIWKKNCDLPVKILATVLVLLTSWVGLAVYYFIVRNKI